MGELLLAALDSISNGPGADTVWSRYDNDGPDGIPNSGDDDGIVDVVPANAQIRTMAASEGAILVDLYPIFDGQTSTLLGLDGLHPNEAGYAKMAETFYNAIRDNLEVR
jgi:hypothetical protein